MAKSEDIRTNRLLITPFSERHLTERYVEWLNDSNLMRYSEQRHKIHTIESCRKYMQSFENTPNYFWAIEEVKIDNRHIGNINSYVDKNNLLADIGILIGDTTCGGKGYATEAMRVIVDFLFKKQKLRKITSGTISSNKAMLKILKKVGMVEDGIRYRHSIWEGIEVDVIHMRIFRDDWPNKNKLMKERRLIKCIIIKYLSIQIRGLGFKYHASQSNFV